MSTTATSPSPSEIRAQGVALLILGYSCRRVERELRAMFPGARVPSYPTISRWLRRRPASNIGLWRWAQTMHRIAEIIEERIDELGTMPLDKLARTNALMVDTYCTARAALSRR